jgi:hypothetical protein
MPKRMIFMLVSLVFVLSIGAGTGTAAVAQTPEADDEVVLPSRIASLSKRIQRAMDKATDHVDEAEYPKAIISLRAVRKHITAINKAAVKQLSAAPVDPEDEPEPADPNAEEPEAPEEAATTPADVVVAVLTLEQGVITDLSGLLNGNTGSLVGAIGTSMTAVQTARDNLINQVVGLDPEGAGADYADVMADSVAGYDDEVASITDALADDTLSAGGKSVLTSALAKSKATQAKIALAFGGGE